MCNFATYKLSFGLFNPADSKDTATMMAGRTEKQSKFFVTLIVSYTSTISLTYAMLL